MSKCFNALNNSFTEGILHEYLKIAKIITFFKSGDSNSTTNYRPISMLPFLLQYFKN